MSLDYSIRLLKQAEHDVSQAGLSEGQGAFDHACYFAQQCAEKAVKAVFPKIGMKIPTDPTSHSISEMVRSVGIAMGKKGVSLPAQIVSAAKEFDQVTFTDDSGTQYGCQIMAQTRYADKPSVGNKAPYEIIDSNQARRKILAAREILEWSRKIS